jgi:hypothetical protein
MPAMPTAFRGDLGPCIQNVRRRSLQVDGTGLLSILWQTVEGEIMALEAKKHLDILKQLADHYNTRVGVGLKDGGYDGHVDPSLVTAYCNVLQTIIKIKKEEGKGTGSKVLFG